MFRHVIPTSLGALTRRAPRLIAGFSLAALTTIFINDNVYEITPITGTSMQPTLSPNIKIDRRRDAVIWSKWDPTRGLKRGDVVLFHTPHNPNRVSAKRVIALPGDTVILDPRRRPRDTENGRKNPDARQWDIRFAASKGRVLLPEGHVWLEGDNRRHTRDSNAYGPVSRALIEGKAIGLFWPLSQIGTTPWKSYRVETRVIEGVEPRSIKDVDNSMHGWWETH